MDGGGSGRPGATAATTTVGVRELREGLARYLSEAEAGATVVVTRDGKPVARLVPPEDALPVRIPWDALKGQPFWMADDFDDPDPEIEAAMHDDDVFPPDEGGEAHAADAARDDGAA